VTSVVPQATSDDSDDAAKAATLAENEFSEVDNGNELNQIRMIKNKATQSLIVRDLQAVCRYLIASTHLDLQAWLNQIELIVKLIRQLLVTCSQIL
jgi:hypothetical protein